MLFGSQLGSISRSIDGSARGRGRARASFENQFFASSRKVASKRPQTAKARLAPKYGLCGPRECPVGGA